VHADERRLVSAAQRGDRDSAVELLERHRPMLTVVCRSVAGDLGEAALQRLAEKSWPKSGRSIRKKRSFGEWLRIVALNGSRMTLSPHRRRLTATPDQWGTSDSRGSGWTTGYLVLAEIMETLDAASQRIVLEYLVFGRTISDIAEMLLMTETDVSRTVQRINSRARTVGHRHG
jgi:DNA-directed RNA polymerase specialized sigma24 family protein